MPVSNPMKTVSRSSIACDGRFDVTLSFDATAELQTSPADIVLIMDRSGSMSGSPMEAARLGAADFLEIVAAASGGTAQALAGGSRMALVSFADTATEDSPLTADTAPIAAAIQALRASGRTNHEAAFQLARTLYDPASSNRKVMVMFTDGLSTIGSADAEVESIKQSGIELFCIGLVSDPAQLNLWASDPDSTHVAYTDSFAQLRRVFGTAAAEVVQAGALDAVLDEVLAPDFKIVQVGTPSHGTAEVLTPQALRWTAGAVGAAGTEQASLTFTAVHIGTGGGEKAVNASLTYTDRSGGTLDFPEPRVTVRCADTAVFPEPCPLPHTFLVAGCRDAAAVEAGDVFLSSLGRIVQVDAVVKHVCPGKQVAVAVLLSEVDEDGVEHARGTKTILIPPQGGTDCRDIQLRCINFVVPEALDISGNTQSICNDRGFRTRVLANYVDTDFVCCDPQTVIL